MQGSASFENSLLHYADDEIGFELKLPLSLLENNVDDRYYQVSLEVFAGLMECKTHEEFSNQAEKTLANNKDIESVWLSDENARLSLWGQTTTPSLKSTKEPAYHTLRMVFKNSVQIRKKIYLK